MCDWSTKQPRPEKTWPRQAQMRIQTTNACVGTEFQDKSPPALGASPTCWTTKVPLSFSSPVLNCLMPPMQLMYVLKRGSRNDFVQSLVLVN